MNILEGLVSNKKGVVISKEPLILQHLNASENILNYSWDHSELLVAKILAVAASHRVGFARALDHGANKIMARKHCHRTVCP